MEVNYQSFFEGRQGGLSYNSILLFFVTYPLII